MSKFSIKKIILCLLPVMIVFAALTAVIIRKSHTGSNTDTAYGVFLDYDGDLSDLSRYERIVIDAQYHNRDEIKAYCKERGYLYYISDSISLSSS